MITIKHFGDFEKTLAFLNKMKKKDARSLLDRYGKRGVDALRNATPTLTGTTAASWTYDIVTKNGRYEIVWSNTNVNNGVNIAMIIQYGHGTRQGGYVQGVDYINPALGKIFEEMASELWGEVIQS